MERQDGKLSEELRFDGKVAIVTGAGNGVGRAYALELARRGAKVVVNDVGAAPMGGGSDPTVAPAVVDEIKRAGGDAVASVESVVDGSPAIVRTALDAYGRIDIVVANAGFQGWGSFADTPSSLLRELFEVHTVGMWEIVQSAWPHLVQQKSGRIMLTTSTAGVFGFPTVAAYGTVKAAAIGMVKSIAPDAIEHGIQINLLAPGAKTRIHSGFGAEWQEFADEHMRPEFPAAAMAYLVHESCEANGRIFTALTHRMNEVIVSSTRGLALPADEWSAEAVRDGWDAVCERGDELVPVTGLDEMSRSLELLGVTYPDEGVGRSD